jgi:antitoxin component YwqK of YwqJK toxin-antitoxin module
MRFPRLQFGLSALFIFVAVSGLFAWYLSGYMPGTLNFDDNGFPHGTGTKRYFYESGALKLEESYYAGNLETSRWYRPDGTLVMKTKWKAGSGVGI